MNSLLRFFISPARGPASILLVRLAVGLIFFTQGILKYLDPNMGLVRFTKIGFPHPYFTAGGSALSRGQSRVAYPLRRWQRVGPLFALFSSFHPSSYTFQT